MKPTTQATKEESATQFDKKMVQEMKKIPELQNLTEEQLYEYCSILRCYSELIVSSVINKIEEPCERSTFKLTSTPLKQAA